jgi:hypothetical protein
MSAVNQPYVTASLVPDASVASLAQPRVLIVGSISETGDGVKRPFFGEESEIAFLQAGTQSSYELSSDDAVRDLIGVGSVFERYKAAKAGSAQVVPIDFLLVNTFTTATTTITVSEVLGTAGGLLRLSVFDASQFTALINLSGLTTASEVADAISNALLGIPDLPAEVAALGAVVSVSWKDGFVTGSTPIHVSTPAGGSFAVAVSVSSQDAPVLTNVTAELLDLIGDTRYTHILWPDYFYSKINIIDDLLRERFNVFNDVASGAAWTSITLGSVVELQEATATLNSQNLIFVAAKKVNGLFGASIGADKTRLPDCDVAFLAAAHARMLTPDAGLTDLGFIAEGAKDYTGGYHMASFPMHNIVIPNVVPANPRWYFTHVEQALLNASNVSTYGVNRTGTTTISGNMLTMWKTDAAGNVNLTYKQAEYLYTAMTVREWMDSAARVKYGSQRMTNGETIIGHSMINQASVEEWVLSQYRNLANMTLVTKGGAAEKSFRKGLMVTLKPAQTRISFLATYEIVTHVGIIDMTLRTTTQYGV